MDLPRRRDLNRAARVLVWLRLLHAGEGSMLPLLWKKRNTDVLGKHGEVQRLWLFRYESAQLNNTHAT